MTGSQTHIIYIYNIMAVEGAYFFIIFLFLEMESNDFDIRVN